MPAAAPSTLSSARIVGAKSIADTNASTRRPGWTIPAGQRMTSGTRWAGSKVCPLIRGNGIPWSLVTITSVFSASPAASSAASSAPMSASKASISVA
jgi:hypothetical protein